MNPEIVSPEAAVQRLADLGNIHAKRITSLETKILTVVKDAQEMNKNSSEQMAANMTTMEANLTQRMDRFDQRSDAITQVLQDLKNELRSLTRAFGQQDSNELPTDYDPAISRVQRDTSTPRDQSNAFVSHHQTGINNDSNIPNAISFVPNQQVNRFLAPTIVIPPASTVPIFHGKSSENPQQFLIRVKEYAQGVTHWDDYTLLNGISQFFLDTALDWYCQLRANNRRPESWSEFEIVFLNQFNSPMHRTRRLQEWRECVQGSNENISDFVVRLRKIWSQVKPKETEEDFLGHLTCKVRSELVYTIGASGAKTNEGIIAELQRMEQIFSRRNLQQERIEAVKPAEFKSATRMSTYQAGPHYSKTSVSNRPMNTYRNTQNRSRHANHPSYSWKNTNSSQPVDGIYCYICGEAGHLSPNCPYQQNDYQHQQQWNNYSKNRTGALVGRDNDAPM